MDTHKTIMLLSVVVILMTGCVAQEPKNAVKNSEVVKDISSQGTYLYLQLEDNPKQDDEYCQTQMIGNVAQTQCWSDWKEVDIKEIKIYDQEGSIIQEYQGDLNGNEISFQTDTNGEYEVIFISDMGETSFTAYIKNGQVNKAMYDNTL